MDKEWAEVSVQDPPASVHTLIRSQPAALQSHQVLGLGEKYGKDGRFGLL